MDISEDKKRKKDTDILAQDSRLFQSVHSIFIYIYPYFFILLQGRVRVVCTSDETDRLTQASRLFP